MHTQIPVSVANVNGTILDDEVQICKNTNVDRKWMNWCRLCAKDDPNENTNIFLKDEQLAANNNIDNGVGLNGEKSDWSLATAIQKHFCIQIKHGELLPNMLCTECFSLVTSLSNFTERVSKVQQMFESLQKLDGEVDLHTVRLKHGLFDDDRAHFLVHQLLPEVHYFDSKPKVNDVDEQFFEAEPESVTTNPLEQDSIIGGEIKKEDSIDERKEVLVLLDEQNIDAVDNEDPFNGYEKLPVTNEYELTSDHEFDSSSNNEEETVKTQSQDMQQSNENAQQRLRHRNQQDEAPKSLKKVRSETETEEEDAEDSDYQNSNGKKKLQNESYPCTECPRKFKRIQHYRQHMERMHLKSIPRHALQCRECNRTFNTKYQLEKHAKVHLPLQLKKILPCPYCEKKFTTNTLVQTHIKYIHMNERPFICEECGVAVRTNAALKTHMLTHTDYAPFICEICKKGFKNQIRLKNHMETHDPNKHICAECGLQLNSRATLNRHLLVHSDEMQHKCDYCGRAFKRAKALKNHLILHTGLKPYSCDFCDRTFANGSNCRSHKKKAHPEELAALEASGGGKQYTRNIPKLEALKAVTKATDNLAPVVSKQSGRFAFGKKPKMNNKDNAINNGVKTNKTNNSNMIVLSNMNNLQVSVNNLNTREDQPCPSIPTIDNIYNHIMKQATLAIHQGNNPPNSTISTNDACLTNNNQQSNPTNVPHMQIQSLQQHSHPNAHHHQQQQQQNNTSAVLHQLDVQQATSMSAQHFYTQILKQANGPLSDHQQVKGLLDTTLTSQDNMSVHSPNCNEITHITNNEVPSNVGAQFYSHLRPGLSSPFI